MDAGVNERGHHAWVKSVVYTCITKKVILVLVLIIRKVSVLWWRIKKTMSAQCLVREAKRDT